MNRTTSPVDVLELVDVRNGITRPVWSAYTKDVDRSGVTQAADVLAIIDLLRGAASFEVWSGRTLLPAPAECPLRAETRAAGADSKFLFLGVLSAFISRPSENHGPFHLVFRKDRR